MTSCDIIRDLLPLVHDDACSPASRALVDEHVAACGACRDLLSGLSESLPPPAISFLPPVSRLRQAKNRLVRKTALAVTAVFCAMGIFAAGGASLYGEFERERAVPWSQTLAEASSGGSGIVQVHIGFSPERYARASCLFRRVAIGGEERDIAILQLAQTWARKYLDTVVGGPEEVALGAGTGLYIGKGGQKHDVAYGPEYAPEYWNPAWVYGGNLSAVYYLDSPSPLDLKDAMAQVVLEALELRGVLLWEQTP
ncbi:MAG: zf-HC2 domain-containing protein [Oscillospiraceae bacterium]|jgi:hypothetical protein|nr:zf-HC2 domain-containing protein [Oscillospiraceae bacterium]